VKWKEGTFSFYFIYPTIFIIKEFEKKKM